MVRKEALYQKAAERFGRNDDVFFLYVQKGSEWMKRVKEFERERALLRMDYLVRGICEREVDGLLDDPSLYKCGYIPKEFRFSFLDCRFSLLGEVVFGITEELYFTEEQWRQFLLFLQEEDI
ncbi:hypothetical protein [Ectobacillus panaciterrae]|uniref:hypothetical protein n=1 Tax=Ectobacillus panaciterrae TaxID=363872 RepID=UPI0003F934EA|nr:hypothetical protein [Ectobacillus panaciterrae]